MSKYKKRMLGWCMGLVACNAGMIVARLFKLNIAWYVCLGAGAICTVMWAVNFIKFMRED